MPTRVAPRRPREAANWMPQTIKEKPVHWAMGATAVLALGSIGPWAQVTFLGITVSKGGLSGDGVITMILAIAAFVALLRLNQGQSRGVATAAVVAGGLAVAVSVYDLVNISNSYRGLVHPGWGLYLAAVGSIALTTFAYVARRAASDGKPTDAVP